MRAIPTLLSKTKLMRGYRCSKCIYLTVHHPELEAPITPDIQALFDQGNAVGLEAHKVIPGGVLIDHKPWDFGGALNKTRELLASDQTIIYEAAFEYAGCYARADIIQKNPLTNKWQIFEVKSTTKVKPEHLDDIGLQAWIMAKSGLPLEKIHIMHLNPACRYPDLSNLFSTVDVTHEIRETYLSIQPKVHKILSTIRQPTTPDTDIGAHCTAPTECSFKQYCWREKNVPPISIFNLPGIKQRKWELYQQGIISLDDPRLTDLSDMQQRVVTAFKSNKAYVDDAAIQAALTDWQFPLIFLDFETINPAIPRYHGIGPYQHVPFQFSAHRWQDTQADLQHTAYLHEHADDPRPALIPALLEACGTEGSIVAYYGKFEADRIQELATYAPQYHDDLLKLTKRIVDPLPIIRDNIYDNAFAGSFSLKSVVPALLGDAHGYQDMQVANGGDAQRAFEKLISPATSPAKKQALKQAMLDYCNKDTMVMVELVKYLKSLLPASSKGGA